MEIVIVVALTPQQTSGCPRTLGQTGLRNVDCRPESQGLRGQECYVVEKEKQTTTRHTNKNYKQFPKQGTGSPMSLSLIMERLCTGFT